MTQKEIERLKALIDHYLDTLDDWSRDEIFGTDRGIAKSKLDEFIVWLES